MSDELNLLELPTALQLHIIECSTYPLTWRRAVTLARIAQTCTVFRANVRDFCETRAVEHTGADEWLSHLPSLPVLSLLFANELPNVDSTDDKLPPGVLVDGMDTVLLYALQRNNGPKTGLYTTIAVHEVWKLDAYHYHGLPGYPIMHRCMKVVVDPNPPPPPANGPFALANLSFREILQRSYGDHPGGDMPCFHDFVAAIAEPGVGDSKEVALDWDAGPEDDPWNSLSLQLAAPGFRFAVTADHYYHNGGGGHAYDGDYEDATAVDFNYDVNADTCQYAVSQRGDILCVDRKAKVTWLLRYRPVDLEPDDEIDEDDGSDSDGELAE